MKTLVLVRHALAGSNRDGIASCKAPGEGLTAEGIEQARLLGVQLADETIALAAATDFARTQETLRLALGGRDVPVLVVPELNEIDFGSFDGGQLDTYRAWAAERSPLERPARRGESRADAAGRYARGLRILLAREEEAILVVGHALFVRYVLDAARGLVPAPLMLEPVAHAVPHLLKRTDVERAADELEAWSREPRFREL